MANIVVPLAEIEAKVANNLQEMANIAKAEVAFFFDRQISLGKSQIF